MRAGDVDTRRVLDANVVRAGDLDAIRTVVQLASACASVLGRLGVAGVVFSRKYHLSSFSHLEINVLIHKIILTVCSRLTNTVMY